jgi:diadenylate cyclase
MAAFFYHAWNHGLKHVLDILLVSFIIYRLMLLIRGTRSMQILQGILFFAVGTFVVEEVLHLNATGWLVQRFWVAGVVVLAVVFQPEIRSALAQLGGQPLSRWILPNSLSFIDEMIGALKECSEKRIGALIVLEQDTGLKNFIETGTKINAEISSALILSILHPRSPLHDGAIVVSGNQMAAAGCVLPITDDPHFVKVLGMRHRAAVGLTEFSDAVVLVVSEETGEMSVARDGKLQRAVQPDDLKEQLYELYRAKANRSLIRKPGDRQAV